MSNSMIASVRQNSPRSGSDENGFTLVEVLVVLIIIGIIAGIAIVSINGASKGALQKSCRTNYYAVQAAIRIYQNDHAGELPKNTEANISLDGLLPEYIAPGLLNFEGYTFTMVSSTATPFYQIFIQDKNGNPIPAGQNLAAPEACSSV